MKEDQLFNLISQQTDYIDQLEKSNLFLKYELGKFQTDLKRVIEENEVLYKESQSVLARATLAESHKITLKSKSLLKNTRQNIVNKGETLQGDGAPHIDHKSKDDKTQNWKAELQHIKSMYTAEISKLKQELLAAKKDIKVEYSEMDQRKEEEKTDNSKLDNTDKNETYKKSKAMIDELLSERKDLLDTITGLNAAVNEYRNQEAVLRKEVQKSLMSLEEWQLEYSQLNLEKNNLEYNLKETYIKLKDSTNDTQRLIQEALEQHKKESSAELANLKKEVMELESSCSKFKISQERVKSQNVHLLSSLQEMNGQLLLKEKALALLKNEVNTAVQNTARANDTTELELRDTKLRLENELQIERQNKLVIEQKNLKLNKRLEEAQNEALQIQELNVSLITELNKLQVEVNSRSKQLIDVQKDFALQYEVLQKQYTEQCSQQANSMELMETNYRQRLQDLETLSSKQAELISKLKVECFSLDSELTDVSHKYEKDITVLSQTNMELLVRAKKLVERNEELTTQCVQHGIAHRNMKEYMNEWNINSKKSTTHMLDVLNEELKKSK